MGSDSLGTSVGNSEESESSSSDVTGDGDGDPAGDGDGDPTNSGDGDGDSTTTGDGDGDPTTTGDGDGDPTTTGDGDGDNPNLSDDYRYAFSVQAGTWSKIPLVSVWNDPNAPLETEIVGATRLVNMPWVMLFGADGNLYERQAGAWQATEPINARFPMIANMDLGSVYHVADPNNSSNETLTFIDNPDAVLYDVFDNGSVTFNLSVITQDDPPPGPPQNTGRVLWSFVNTDLDLYGQSADWWVGWFGYNDGFIYRLDGAAVWSRFSIVDNAFFGTNDPDEPDPTAMRAAWYEPGPGGDDYLYMVGP